MGRAKAKQNLAAEAPWAADDEEPVPCSLCGRTDLALPKHHLVPRAIAGRARVKREHAGTDLKHRCDFRNRTISLCRPCHRTVHATLTEKELAADFHTLATLRGHPALVRFARFAAKQALDRRVAVRKPK